MQHWVPDQRFAGRTVYVLGNGPSLADFDLTALDPAEVIAVNASAKRLPDAAVLFARDQMWCVRNIDVIAAWRGLAVTSSRPAAGALAMRFVLTERRDDFPPPGAMAIRYGVSSGHTAVALALAMAARTIVLIGFDGRAVGKRTHWHDDYTAPPHIYEARFVPAWKGWRKAAAAHGCRILNATPNSAISEFPFVDLDEARAA